MSKIHSELESDDLAALEGDFEGRGPTAGWGGDGVLRKGASGPTGVRHRDGRIRTGWGPEGAFHENLDPVGNATISADSAVDADEAFGDLQCLVAYFWRQSMTMANIAMVKQVPRPSESAPAVVRRGFAIE